MVPNACHLVRFHSTFMFGGCPSMVVPVQVSWTSYLQCEDRRWNCCCDVFAPWISQRGKDSQDSDNTYSGDRVLAKRNHSYPKYIYIYIYPIVPEVVSCWWIEIWCIPWQQATASQGIPAKLQGLTDIVSSITVTMTVVTSETQVTMANLW